MAKQIRTRKPIPFRFVLEELEARQPLYRLAHASFDTSGKPVTEIVPALLTLLPPGRRSAPARSLAL